MKPPDALTEPVSPELKRWIQYFLDASLGHRAKAQKAAEAAEQARAWERTPIPLRAACGFILGAVGAMHPNGSIELRDLKKDIIISGGENISTIEVEQAIASHPAVLEVAVFAAPDDEDALEPRVMEIAQPSPNMRR